MAHSHPALDYPVFGLGPEWSGPRWFDFVEGQADHPTWAAWLGHGQEFDTVVGRSWAHVGTYSRERCEQSGVGRGSSFAPFLAESAAMSLLDDGATAPDEVDAVAAAWQTWELTDVVVDGRTLPGRRLAHRGAWAFVAEGPDTGLVVHWSGMGDAVPALADVATSTLYAVDFSDVIAYPSTLLRSRSAALGDDRPTRAEPS